MPSRMRDSGVRSSCEALASSMRCAPTSSSMRAAARLKLVGQPRDLVLALDLDARRQIAGAERLDAGLQALQPPRQAAHDRIGARARPPARCRRGTAAARSPDARCRAGARTTIQRPSGRRKLQAGPPGAVDPAAVAVAAAAAAAAGRPPRSAARVGRTARGRCRAAAPDRSTACCCVGARRVGRRQRAGRPVRRPSRTPAPPAVRRRPNRQTRARDQHHQHAGSR